MTASDEALESQDQNPQLGEQGSKNNVSRPEGHEEKTTVVVNVGDENVEKPNPRRGWWQRS